MSAGPCSLRSSRGGAVLPLPASGGSSDPVFTRPCPVCPLISLCFSLRRHMTRHWDHLRIQDKLLLSRPGTQSPPLPPKLIAVGIRTWTRLLGTPPSLYKTETALGSMTGQRSPAGQLVPGRVVGALNSGLRTMGCCPAPGWEDRRSDLRPAQG